MISTKPLTDNLKNDKCSCLLNMIIPPYKNGQTVRIKLYRTIKEACLQKGRSKEYELKNIIELNNETNRPTHIICRLCKNKDCVISLRVDEHENTRFCNCKNIQINVV